MKAEIQVFDGPEAARRRLEAERDAYRAALENIAKCNRGEGHMPELAQRVLTAWRKAPLT